MNGVRNRPRTILSHGTHLCTWLSIEMHGSILTLSTRHLNNDDFLKIEMSVYLMAWLLTIIHFCTQAKVARDIGTVEVTEK